MNKIPTVDNFFNQYGGYTREEMLKRAIEFAKLHVKAALEAAHRNMQLDSDDLDFTLSSYPEELIK